MYNVNFFIFSLKSLKNLCTLTGGHFLILFIDAVYSDLEDSNLKVF